MKLTIVGLGPGRWELLTGEAQAVLTSAPEVWLRTSRHPIVAHLLARLTVRSFDDLADASEDLDRLDQAIATRVVELAERPAGVVYAVPGHPLVGDAGVQRIVKAAAGRGYQPRIVPGLSFVDVAIARLGLDPLDRQLQIGNPRDLRADPARPLLIGRLDDARLVTATKLSLLQAYPADHPVTLIHSAGLGEADAIREVPLGELDRQADLDHLTGAYLPAVPSDGDYRTFAATCRIIAQLRAPGGCPWDREQTAETLKPYVVEEAYEVVEAIDGGDPDKLAEELGDLLLQVVLQAQLADEAGAFSIADVIEAINTKLVRRHPHVFGDQQVKDAREVLANWETLKERERAPDSSLLKDLPRHLPALAYTQTLQRKLARLGLQVEWDPESVESLIGALGEPGERRRGESTGSRPDPSVGPAAVPVSQEDRRSLIGQLIWRLAAFAGSHEIDLEDALRTLNRRVVESFRRAEAAAGGDRAAATRLAEPDWRELIDPAEPSR